jgi:hypothetical protein
VNNEAALTGNLYGAVAGCLNGVAKFARLVGKYCYDYSLGVIAVCLVYLVAHCKFGSHGESSSKEARRLLGFKYGFFAFGKAAVHHGTEQY